ncbi:MAG: TlpA family protein disulfide reductase [Prolixibacteraceae bacterium]
MKTILFILLAFLGFNVASAKVKIVDFPPFNVWSHTSIEIEKIALSDTATVLYINAFYRPNMWIRISSDSYLGVNGEKVLIKSSNGIGLDAECYMDSTGQKKFSLVFPPIDRKTERIDFIESDCDNCFKIWGIELNSKKLTVRTEVPKEIKKLAEVNMNDSPELEIPIFNASDAVLKGKFLGYVPGLNYSVKVYVNNPVTRNQEESSSTVAADGSFELKVPMVCDMQVLLRTNFYNKYILLSPGQESSVYFDLQQKCRQDSHLRKDKFESSEFMFFGGAWANINNQLSRTDILRFNDDYDKRNAEIVGMDANHFKAYVLKKQEDIFQNLGTLGLSPKALALSKLFCQHESLYHLFMAQHELENAFRKANNLNYEDDLVGFEEPNIDENFYSFLNDFPINNPISLYSENYGNTVSSCRYLNRSKSKRISLNYLKSDILQELIKTEQLSKEENEVVNFMISEDYDNWDQERIAFLKKGSIEFCDTLLLNKQLTADDKKEVEKFRTQVLANDSRSIDIIESRLELINFQLKKNPNLPEELLVPFAPGLAIDSSVIALMNRRMEFEKKYKSKISEITQNKKEKEVFEHLANIIGTDKGIAFDLMYTQQKCAGFESYEILSENDLLKIAAMDNPFYASYISGLNNELIQKIEANKGKGGYSVHEVPETSNDSLFIELLKPFEGKVVLCDFWATWCGPCRMAMKEMEPAKATYEGKDVVFVYLTDESSPLETWNNMIPDIHGEHFRLKNEQFAYLKNKFGVRGVPSYLLLNKQGEQIYFKVGFEGVYTMSNLINEALTN